MSHVLSSAFVLTLVLLLSGCSEQTAQLENGRPAPAFELPDLSGRPVRFPDDLKGKITAIRFWADWCPFCRQEMADLEPVYRKYRDRGLRILAVNVRQERDTAARFVAGLGISYDTLLDGEGEVARSYGVTGLPTTYFIDPKGILRARILGESTPQVFERILREILDEE